MLINSQMSLIGTVYPEGLLWNNSLATGLSTKLPVFHQQIYKKAFLYTPLSTFKTVPHAPNCFTKQRPPFSSKKMRKYRQKPIFPRQMIERPYDRAGTDLLLQLQPLPIESLLGLLPSFSEKSSFEFVSRSISQCVHQALESLHLGVADLDRSG